MYINKRALRNIPIAIGIDASVTVSLKKMYAKGTEEFLRMWRGNISKYPSNFTTSYMLTFKAKIMNIIITGSSKGIGKALSGYYLKQGHHVRGISRSIPADLEDYPNYSHYYADFSDTTNLQKQLKPVFTGLKHMDLVILNAGIINKIADMKDCSLDEFRYVMDVNVWANKLFIDTLIERLPASKQIVAISSGAAVRGNRGWNAYSMSKAALNMLVDLYSKELKGIHISAMAPGIIDTDLQDYIASLRDVEKYPTMQRLQKAKGSSQMPAPEEAASKLATGFNRLLGYPSGSFVDIRDM